MDLEKATNRNISLPEQMWRELDEIAQAWGIPRSMAIRLILNDWKDLRSKQATEKSLPLTLLQPQL